MTVWSTESDSHASSQSFQMEGKVRLPKIHKDIREIILKKKNRRKMLNQG